jgi:hypothetical protein
MRGAAHNNDVLDSEWERGGQSLRHIADVLCHIGQLQARQAFPIQQNAAVLNMQNIAQAF